MSTYIVPAWLRARRRKRWENLVKTGKPSSIQVSRRWQATSGENGPQTYEASRSWTDVEPSSSLLADVAFNRHSMNDGHHVSPLDNGKVQVGADGIRVELAQGIHEDDFKCMMSAATRATIGVDLDRESPESLHLADWEEMLKGGLQTALESQVIIFAVSGVSRTCTHQLVRSRKAAFHQSSQRASYIGDLPEVRMPESVWRNNEAREAFMHAIEAAHVAYRIACAHDISYQDARYVLPEGTDNYIMCEYSLREFMNVFAYRGCSMFSWEIVHVMREMRRTLLEHHPWLEPYIKISCEKTGPRLAALDTGARARVAEHSCTFQGWESPEGQCDFPWAKDENRTFKPEFHQIKRRPDTSEETPRPEPLSDEAQKAIRAGEKQRVFLESMKAHTPLARRSKNTPDISVVEPGGE